MKINIYDDGSVECVSHNGIDMEHLKANNVKVGRQYEAKSLYEIFASQLEQKSSETVTILQPPSTNVTGAGARNLAEERAEDYQTSMSGHNTR